MSDQSLLIRGRTTDHGLSLAVSPLDAGWNYIGFEMLHLPKGAVWEGSGGDREIGLVPISGVARVTSGTNHWPEVGGRLSPFDGSPHCLYLPGHTSYRIEARTTLELALCTAPAVGDYPPLLITPEQVEVHVRGEGQCSRQIHNMLMEDRPAGSLLLTEVHSPAGNWSSYPGHKHDTDNLPEESPLEETYYFKIRPKQGFALQRVYTADGSLDQSVAPRDGDLVLVPRGYHIVAAPHAYEVYYLNVLAGPRRTLRVTFDPEHVWIKESWNREW